MNPEAASGLDLAYRISLTGKVEEQKEGLKRVPSFGGTSELDLTVPDSEFFGNSKICSELCLKEIEKKKKKKNRIKTKLADYLEKFKMHFLAHLSRRLTGELIVYPCSGVRRPSSSVVVHNFKDLLL